MNQSDYNVDAFFNFNFFNLNMILASVIFEYAFSLEPSYGKYIDKRTRYFLFDKVKEKSIDVSTVNRV